jgi:EF-P beta-lysylation protein EpmB
LPGQAAVEGAGDKASWQRALREAVRDPLELCRLLDLPPQVHPAALAAAQAFPLRVPRSYVARMRKGDPADPLLLQVLPLADEMTPVAGFTADPVGDGAASTAPGLLHKYQGRVLLVLTGACAVHCRYCFRRHFPYSEGPHSLADWEPALEYLAVDPSIHEVILSGGDPLSLVDAQLARLVERLAEIPHVTRLRVHSRWPIVIPERVDDGLLAWLTGTRLVPWMVVHANHAQELDDSTSAALGRLVSAGVPVLNQAVLLKGVNDSVDALAELCERLIDLRVLPYYLHQLDRVAGAAHFEVPEAQGRAIVEQLRTRLPGYAVPQYVREEAGREFKVPVQ